MKKEYRNAIIGGIASGLGGTTVMYLIQGKVTWAYLITYPIFFVIAKLLGHLLRDRREEKKDQRVQREGLAEGVR